MATPKTEQLDALRLLAQDHAKVKELLTQLAETTTRATKGRTELLEKIGEELRVHAAIEEEIFYPALDRAAKNNEQRELMAEARQEHQAVEELVLPELENSDVDSVEFGGRAKVLKELVEHHAEEEEEEMFAHARELLDQETLSELGARMQARKDELLA